MKERERERRGKREREKRGERERESSDRSTNEEKMINISVTNIL